MRILYSTSRIAMRSHVLREICALSSTRPNQRILLIVPEQTKMDMERDLLELSEHPGLMMAEVLSFRRLAWRLMSEVGRQPHRTIDRVGQGMLIHSILKAHKHDLHAFGHLADRPGFISQAAAALGDMRRCRIDAGQLATASAETDDKALRDKMADLSVLLSGYEESLAGSGLSDAEDDLARLGDLLDGLARRPDKDWPWPQSRLEWIRSSHVWISGFAEIRDFTPQEDRILKALNRLCNQITLTVAADFLPFDRSAADAGPDCFLSGRKAVLRIMKEFPTVSHTKIEAAESGVSAAIAAGIREDGPFRPTGSKGWLKLVRTEGIDDELTWVAGEIRRLVQEDNYRYKNITLAVSDLPMYAPRLRAVFREYGLPLFLDTDRPVSGTPLIRFVLSLLDVGLYNWPQSFVMICLRTGITPLDPDEIDCLENEILSRGISRQDRLFDDRRYSSPQAILSRDKALAPLREVLVELRTSKVCAEKCRTLHRFLQSYGVKDRLETHSVDLVASGESDLAVAQVLAWNELLRVLQQMTELDGDADMDLQTFRDLLATGLDSAGASVIPTAIDQVAVGDLQRAILRQPLILFVVGASADRLPPRAPPEGLLKDQDRQTLSGLLETQMPSIARDQVFADSYIKYTLLTLPANRLYISAPTDAVSPWFSWLAEGDPTCITTVSAHPDWDDPRLNAMRPAFSYLVSQCGCDRWEGMGWLLVGLALAKAGMPLHAAVDWLQRASRPEEHRLVRIKPQLVRKIFGEQPSMSVSQLEKYAGCPFAHLANYILALRDREIWEPEAADTGTLLHGVIEQALRELCDGLRGLEPDDRQGWQAEIERWLSMDIEARIAVWMQMAAERDGLQVFFETGIRASSGRRVRRLASASLAAMLRQYGKGDFKPAFLEWKFGPSEKSRLALCLPDGTSVAFRGKVDRVDMRQKEGITSFRIVDFKSGDKRVDYDALYHGLALQLPAYLEAFARDNPGCLAEDAAYFRFSRPILSLPAGTKPDDAAIMTALEKDYNLRGLKMSPDEISLIRRHAMRRAGELTDNMFAGCFEVAPRKLPGKLPACVYCTFKALCGFDDNPANYCWLTPLQQKKRQTLINSLLKMEQDEEEDACN